MLDVMRGCLIYILHKDPSLLSFAAELGAGTGLAQGRGGNET